MRFSMGLKAVIIVSCLLLFNCHTIPKPYKTFLYVGSYTDGRESTGIHIFEFDGDKGSLTRIDSIKNFVNPSYLDVTPNGKAVIACLESRLEKPGSVGIFKIDTLTGKLKFLNKQTSGGRNPVHVAISPDSKYVVSSNYTDAGISIFRIENDLRLSKPLQHIKFEDSSIVKGRQDESHLHSTNFYENGNSLVGMDLGADKLRLFSVKGDSKPPLKKMNVRFVKTFLGGGPRHFEFHPTLPFGYCALELNGMIAAYRINDGDFSEIGQYESYEIPMESYAIANIHISKDGKFLYASNRNEPDNSISIFEINLNDGSLIKVGHESVRGDHPRNFVIDPTNKWLLVANQNSNEIVVFKRNLKTGLLNWSETIKNINKPSCLKMRSYISNN